MARILCDVDEVLCPLHDEWLRRWNKRTGDDMSPDDISRWEIHLEVMDPKREDINPKDIYEILHEPDLYESIDRTVPGAKAGVSALREDLGHRVVFVSSGNPHTWTQKFRWLQRHGFLTLNDYEARYDYWPLTDKSGVVGEVMIEDGAHNLISNNHVPFKVLIDKPYNQDLGGPDITRVNHWAEIVELVSELRL